MSFLCGSVKSTVSPRGLTTGSIKILILLVFFKLDPATSSRDDNGKSVHAAYGCSQ
ncbi:hypothetical protein [Rickettsia sp.]|uniref:hypothetical protein n=1 Tax=Rickettsia sp. TaxID=789 RepID=UPI00397CCBE1